MRVNPTFNVDLPAKVTWTVEFSGVSGDDSSTGESCGFDIGRRG